MTSRPFLIFIAAQHSPAAGLFRANALHHLFAALPRNERKRHLGHAVGLRKHGHSGLGEDLVAYE